MSVSRVNGGGTTYPVNSTSTARTQQSARQQTTQGTGYSSASSFSGSSAGGASSDQIDQARSDFSNYLDTYMKGVCNPGSSGALPKDVVQPILDGAKAQLDEFLNQQPPPTQDQIDAKVKEIKNATTQKIDVENEIQQLMQDTMNKTKEAMGEAFGSPWGG